MKNYKISRPSSGNLLDNLHHNLQYNLHHNLVVNHQVNPPLNLVVNHLGNLPLSLVVNHQGNLHHSQQHNLLVNPSSRCSYSKIFISFSCSIYTTECYYFICTGIRNIIVGEKIRSNCEDT